MAAGEAVTVCDMQGNEYDCVLEGFMEKHVTARITDKRHSENEPKCYIRLFQALPKGDKLDSIIQKAVECGVSEIIPFESERCIVKIKNDSEEKKNQRRQRIAAEAAKQCGRSFIPEVKASVGFSQMLGMAGESELSLFCYEGDGTLPLGVILKEEAAKNGGALPAFMADLLEISTASETVCVKNVYVAVPEQKLISGGFCALLGTPVFDAADNDMTGRLTAVRR
jgi:RsmE family RNA methyltransferase